MARSASTVPWSCADQRNLGVQRLVRHGILRRQALVAGEIDLRALQQGLVARELSALLRERCFIGPRIDLGEQVAFLDLVAFLEDDANQIAADLGSDGDGGKRGDGPQRIEVDSNIARADRFRNDRHRRAAPRPPPIRPAAAQCRAGSTRRRRR